MLLHSKMNVMFSAKRILDAELIESKVIQNKLQEVYGVCVCQNFDGTKSTRSLWCVCMLKFWWDKIKKSRWFMLNTMNHSSVCWLQRRNVGIDLEVGNDCQFNNLFVPLGETRVASSLCMRLISNNSKWHTPKR